MTPASLDLHSHCAPASATSAGTGGRAAAGSTKNRNTRAVTKTVVASRSAPTATCAVAIWTPFPVQTVSAPRRSLNENQHHHDDRRLPQSRLAGIRSKDMTPKTEYHACSHKRSSPMKKMDPDLADADRRHIVPSHANLIYRRKPASSMGGRSVPYVKGKSGMARPALLWRIHAPRKSWRRTTNTALTANHRVARAIADTLADGCIQAAEVTRARRIVREKKDCASIA